MMRRPPASSRNAAAAATQSGDAASSSSTPASGPSGATNVGGARHPRPHPSGRVVTGQKRVLPLVAVEAAGRVARHAVEQLRPHVVGQHRQHVGRGEGRVQEVHRAQVRPRLGQHPPQQREVVVLHEDGVALARPGRHDVGHGPVVGPVALPRLPPMAVEARPVRQVEEVVVAVPERGVRYHVVGLAVGLVVDDDGEQIEPVLVHEALGDRLAVRRPHRHRGPRRAAPRQDPVQGGGQPAAGGYGDQRALGSAWKASGPRLDTTRLPLTRPADDRHGSPGAVPSADASGPPAAR